MATLIDTLFQLLRSWLQQDRIRIARNSGALLRLEPGDRLLIVEQVYVVVGRQLRYSDPSKANPLAGDANHHVDGDSGLELATTDHLGTSTRWSFDPTEESDNPSASSCMPGWIDYALHEQPDNSHVALRGDAIDSIPCSTAESMQTARLTVAAGQGANIVRFEAANRHADLMEEECIILPRSTRGCECVEL